MAGGLTGVEIASELSAMSLEEEKENVINHRYFNIMFF